MKPTPKFLVAAAVGLACWLSSLQVQAATDLRGWAMVKGQSFWQATGQDPQPESPKGWFAAAGLWTALGAALDITTVYLERSGGNSVLTFDPDGQNFGLQDDAVWNTQAEMDQALPNTFAYKLHWTSQSQGSRVSTLGPLGADNYPASAPRIRNLAALQSLHAGQPFTVQWDAMPNGTTSDWIFVEIWDGDLLVARSPLTGQAGALDGAATAFTVSGGLPAISHTYEVYIAFVKVVKRDTQTEPGAVGVAGFAKTTGAEIRSSAWNWDSAYGPLFNAGGGWYGNPTFGWLWFSGTVGSDHWAWSTRLHGWLGRMGTSTTLWSPQFRWLNWPGTGDGMVHTSALGNVWLGSYQGTAIADGWVISERFGYVWANGDGTWFYSDTHGWLGVTPEGGIWSANEGRFL